MSISKYKTKSGIRYQVNDHLGMDPITGKRINFHRRGFKTRQEAQSALNRARYDFETGKYRKKTRTTYEEVYKTWFPLYAKTVKESTLSRTESCFRLHILPAIGQLPIHKITPIHCQDLAESLSKVYKVYRKIYGYAERVYKYALSIGQVDGANPFERIVFPKADTKPKETLFMDKDELLHLLDCIKETGHILWYAFFYLLAFTGLRKGEALALTWEDLKGAELHVTKTVAVGLHSRQYIGPPKTGSGERIVTLDQRTMQVLSEYRKTRKLLSMSRLMFPNGKGNVMSLSKPLQFLRRVAKKNGLPPYTIHSFRHTHCAMCFEAGWSIKAVQERLGHRDFQTTMNIYNHVTESEEAKNMHKLESFLSS